MEEYTNRGTVMNLTLSNCTVINRGTIMHLGGNDNQIENRGSIMHNNGGRVIIMGTGCKTESPQPQERIIYKDRIVYRDRIQYRDKVIYRDRPSSKKAQQVKDLENELSQLKERIKDSKEGQKITQLENNIIFYECRNSELKQEIELLKAELEGTERTKLLKEIQRLQENLQRSENRERTSREQQYKKGYQAGVVDGSNKKKEVFDWGVRPSKEQAEAVVSQLRIWLDCEE